jgi:hypothetical protein
VAVESEFAYGVPGKIDKINPKAGHTGTSVEIFGTSLRGSGTRVSKVVLGGVEATIVT